MVYFIFHGRLFFLLKVQTHVKLSYYCINSASVKREKYVKCSPRVPLSVTRDKL